MKASLSIYSIVVLIFGGLLLNATKIYAVNTSEKIANQTIEIQNDNRKKLRQEKRKIKRATRRSEKVKRTIGYIVLGVLIVLAAYYLFSIGLLVLDIIAFGFGEGLLLPFFWSACRAALIVWGIVVVHKWLSKIKNSL